MNNMKVKQMINNNGNGATNQFVLTNDNGVIAFQSYDSTIAIVDYRNNTITFGEDWDYSVTTGKHRNIFFRNYAPFSQLTTKKGVEDAIKCGHLYSANQTWIVTLDTEI